MRPPGAGRGPVRKSSLIGTAGSHGDLDASHAGGDDGADLEQGQADGAAGRLGEASVLETDAAQGTEQDIGHRGQPQAELVGEHGVRRGAVGEHVHLAFLDAVLHVSARAVDLLVEMATFDLGATERGDDEARIGLALGPFGFADDAATSAPARARRVPEVLEAPRRLAGPPALRLGLSHVPLDLLGQPFVAGQTEHEVHAIGLAPRHQALACEARIGAHQDAHPRPACPDPADDARQLGLGAGRPVDVGAPQLGRQQVTAARHVQRQIAVVVIIAVEEPPFLMTVQRIVRRIEVEHDLPRRPPMGLHEQVDQQGLDRRAVVADLVILRRLRTTQLQTVQGALARNRRTVRPLRLELAQQHRQQRVMPQMVVIVEVLVAQRQACPERSRGRTPADRPACGPRVRSARDRDDP